MKELLISILRNRDTSMEEFRSAATKLATLLACESGPFVNGVEVAIETPLGTAKGKEVKGQVVLISILRAGLTFLSPFLDFYPEALVGFVGARRDEKTAEPHLYYTKLPPLSPEDSILLLDPMLATGGSSSLAVKLIKEAGGKGNNITLISAIAAPEGVDRLKKEHPIFDCS